MRLILYMKEGKASIVMLLMLVVLQHFGNVNLVLTVMLTERQLSVNCAEHRKAYMPCCRPEPHLTFGQTTPNSCPKRDPAGSNRTD